MASSNSCGISYEQIGYLDLKYFSIGEDMSWVMRNMLEKLIDQPVIISERTLIVANSYNEISGVVRHVNGYLVHLSDCEGLTQYGEVPEKDKWYDIARIKLYHPSMVAFFKIIEDVQDKTGLRKIQDLWD